MSLAVRFVPLSLAIASLLACSRATSSRESVSLGYGPERGELLDGYRESGPPFDRPAPRAWPRSEQPAQAWAAAPPPRLPDPPVAASPDVRQLCVHVVEFLLAQAGESESIEVAPITDFCHIQARTEKLARTGEQWQAFLTCMLAADTDPEFDACEQDNPHALAEPTEHEREQEACLHLAMTSLYEQLGKDDNLTASELERFRPVVRECIDEMIARERSKRSPDEYDAFLDCVLEQPTSDAMQACD
jgi:hypothetical protein